MCSAKYFHSGLDYRSFSTCKNNKELCDVIGDGVLMLGENGELLRAFLCLHKTKDPETGEIMLEERKL